MVVHQQVLGRTYIISEDDVVMIIAITTAYIL